MRVLYISDRREGGIRRHVQCIRSCLPPDIESYAIGEDEPFAGKSGHDWREWFQIRRVIRSFRPNVVHFHTPCFLMALYCWWLRILGIAGFHLVCSWHTPTNGKCGFGVRVFLRLLGSRCYFLPVSQATWNGLRHWLPHARGEVFYNPGKIGIGLRSRSTAVVDQVEGWRLEVEQSCRRSIKQSNTSLPILGMVGRADPAKGWNAFIQVANSVKAKADAWGVGVSRGDAVVSYGEAADTVQWKGVQKNGREWISKMDLFVLTSKHEEMPTVVLECFAEKTPICGFIPEGGMSEILQYSNGALKSVFLKERDSEKLANVVLELLESSERRQALVADGSQILKEHFDAEKNCRGQLRSVYMKIVGLGSK